MVITRHADRVSDDRPYRNKALVLEAMTSLFQRHDVSAVERLYVPDYIQHNPDIPQGRDALQGCCQTYANQSPVRPCLLAVGRPQ